MLFSESEQRWLDRRAAKIAEETGWPLPVARAEATAQLTRSRVGGWRAEVLPFRPRKR